MNKTFKNTLFYCFFFFLLFASLHCKLSYGPLNVSIYCMIQTNQRTHEQWKVQIHSQNKQGAAYHCTVTTVRWSAQTVEQLAVWTNSSVGIYTASSELWAG